MSTLVDLHALTAELKTRHPASAHLAIGIDGSNASEAASLIGYRLFQGANKTGGAKLTLLHISDHSKAYLPSHLQPAHLKRRAEDLSMQNHISQSQLEWACREKLEGCTTLASLTTLAEKKKVDILVMGSHGRKGEKAEMLGTVSEGALRSSHASICIVRSNSTKITGSSCRYTFASDGSHASGIAFSVLVNYLALPTDSINVVIVTAHENGHEQQVASHYAAVLKEANLPGSAVVKRISPSTKIHQGILEFAQEQTTDILVVGVSGYGQKKLGSVSELISREALCTTLIIKDGYQVDPRHFSHAGAATLHKDVHGAHAY